MKKTALPKPALPIPTSRNTEAPDPEPINRILKVGTCPTLSGKSTLTYQIGCNAAADGLLRLHGNSGGGMFNRDWISLEGIRTLVEKWPTDKPITSYALYSLFRGKSSNSPAFLFAVLKGIGWVRQTSEKPRTYGKGDPAPFLDEVKVLIASDTDLQPGEESSDQSSMKAASGGTMASRKSVTGAPA